MAMAYAQHTDRAFDGLALGQRAAHLRESLSARLAWYRHYRRTLDELAQLSDRDLADLGMHRSLIRDVAREAADLA
jgi:uncharacterized protein YjiS (DUF1127 family)